MYKKKEDILLDCPELELTEFGDFKVKNEYVSKYEIIDIHCHLFKGLQEMYPSFLKKEKEDMNCSFLDKSCFPISLNLFDLNEITFTKYPKTIRSLDGIKARIKLLTGAFVLNRATDNRLIRDMKLNHINKSVVLQISPPNKNSMKVMKEITNTYPQLYTFGSIHPNDDHIDLKIKDYQESNIKGWKINPHVCGFNIDSSESIELIKKLSQTNLPIISCSGSYSDEILNTKIFSKKQKNEQSLQRIESFDYVLNNIPNSPFIFAHAGLYEVDVLIELMKKYQNTYADISCQPARIIKKLIEHIGSERLLFGSDYPFLNPAFSIVSVLRATNIEEERENIFSKNTYKLLKI